MSKHQNNKISCVTLTKEITQIKEIKINIKTTLINVFKNCLNILRDNEGLTGEKALRNLSYILILKLLEPHFGNKDDEINNEINSKIDNKINIDNYNFDFSHIEDDMVEIHKNKLLQIVRFSNLAKEKEINIPINIKYLWDDILAVHPSTKNIFLRNKGFDIQHQATFKELIDKIYALDLSNIEYDILGSAYEEVIQDLMTKKVLGQFFTQPLIKKMMVKLINPQIHRDGKIDTCCDPTMGTGGFLITYLQYILQQAKTKNIKLDWNFIKTEGLYGKELEPDTYQLAVSNMLISSGHMFDKLDRGDSIREPITTKFDSILANPPFGIKGLKYDTIKNTLKNEYIPIKSDNAVSLFIQAIIYMLKINGKCAIVLPDGQDLFSKTNTTFIAIREYLMKTCDLKEVIYLPSGIFTYTSIKTCVFYFIKKIEGIDVLKTSIKTSKTQKEIGRDYQFSEIHQTKKIKFYDYDPYNDIKNLLIKVSIEKIADNSYSLNYAEYLKEETNIDDNNNILTKKLAEVCDFQNGYAFKSSEFQIKDETNIGILQIKSIQDGFIDENKITEYIEENKKYKMYELKKGDLLIGLTGTFKIGIYDLEKKTYLNQRVGKITAKSGIIQKYIYYWYLCCDIESEILKRATGVAQANISLSEISNIEIPIPSIEKQQMIVKYLDFIFEKANKTSTEKIAELKQLNEYCLNNQKIFGQNETKNLGDVIKEVKTGKDVVATDRIKGVYPFYGANGVIDYIDKYIFDGKYLLTARTGSLGSLHITNGKFWCSGDVHRMEFDNDITLLYIYYYLKTIDFQKFRTGSAHPKLSNSSLRSITILIPTLERQTEIIKYCEYNDTLMKQLENEIENNKIQAKQFISVLFNTNNIINDNLNNDNDMSNDNDNDNDNISENNFDEKSTKKFITISKTHKNICDSDSEFDSEIKTNKTKSKKSTVEEPKKNKSKYAKN